MTKGLFLTFLILTYRRPAKLKRLLSVFLEPEFTQLKLNKFEIVIADDHGEDDTHEIITPVVDQLMAMGINIRYVYRDRNLRGDANLYEGYAKDSLGEYVWFLCDDDVLIPGPSGKFIGELVRTRPAVAICGFRQGIDNEITNDLGSETRIINSSSEAIHWITKFPKTTAYVFQRIDVDFEKHLERWNGTLFSWIGLAIMLHTRCEGGLLLFPEVAAEADSDFLTLRYSYRVFSKLAIVVRECCSCLSIPFDGLMKKSPHLRSQDELTLCAFGLAAHYSYRSLAKYTDAVLVTEKKYFARNVYRIPLKRTRLMSALKLAYFYTMDKLTIRSGR